MTEQSNDERAYDMLARRLPRGATETPIGQLRRVERLTCKETPLWEPTWAAPEGQQFVVLVLGLAPKGRPARAGWVRARLEEALDILSKIEQETEP